MDIGICNHRLVDDIKIDNHLSVITGVGVGGEWGALLGANTHNTVVGDCDQALKNFFLVVHALIDHDLNSGLGDFK